MRGGRVTTALDATREIERFVSILWLPDDLIEIRPIPLWGATREWIKANDLHAIVPRLREENERGHNLYMGVLPRNKEGGGKAEDVLGGRVLFADFDNTTPEAIEFILENAGFPVPTMIVNSGHGTHIYFRLSSFIERDALHDANARLVRHFITLEETKDLIDPSVKDPARILRLPGFINHKEPIANCFIYRTVPDAIYTLDDFAPFFSSLSSIKTEKREPIELPEDAKLKKAKAYISAIEGSAPGGRTNTGFRVACVLVNDIGVSDTYAQDMLRDWDYGNNNPPIEEDYGPEEYAKLIRNAHNYAKKNPGCLNTSLVADEIRNVDLTPFFESLGTRSSLKKTAIFPERFLDVPGFIGEVMAFNLATAPKPQPVLALAGAIALQAVLCARKVRSIAGTCPNLYICGVAESGAGKDHARQINKKILLESELSALQAEGIKSGSALVNALVIQPSILFQVDEYGRFIKSANVGVQNPHQYEIITKLMTLYTSAGGVYESDRYADVDKGGKRVLMPHAIMYGTTVPGSLYEGLTEEAVTDGFLARTLIFDADGANPIRRRIALAGIPATIVDRATWWGMFNPGGGNIAPDPAIVPTTDEAEAIADSFCDKEHIEMAAMGDNPAKTLWTRTGQNADKLALIYACSKAPESPVVDSEAASWGYEMSEWLTRRMIEILAENVAGNPFHAEALKVLRKIKSAGGSIVHSVLLKRTKLNARLFEQIIGTLQESEQVKVVDIDTGGRPKRIYELAKEWVEE